MATLNAIPILAPAVDWILDGKKTWEIRTRLTHIRGRIGLIRSKSLTIVGTCEILDVIGPLTSATIRKDARSKLNEAPRDCSDYVGSYAWVLGNVRRLIEPIPYKHPSGAVTWVKLDERKAAEVLNAKSKLAGVARPHAAGAPCVAGPTRLPAPAVREPVKARSIKRKARTELEERMIEYARDDVAAFNEIEGRLARGDREDKARAEAKLRALLRP
jgi:hypothetical protein